MSSFSGSINCYDYLNFILENFIFFVYENRHLLQHLEAKKRFIKQYISIEYV